jgi:hypothetical protein
LFHPLRALGWWRSLLTLGRSFRQGVPASGDANGIITPDTYQRLLDAWQLPDRPPPLTQFEKIADGEALAIERMARRAALTVIENYCDGKSTDPAVKAMRDQHAKPHGVLTARFVVPDAISPEFAFGVFRPGAQYDAVVRFSNAQGVPQSDRRPDGRGMAIKLLDVPGPGLLSLRPQTADEASPHTEQDFLLTNYPVFFGKNVPDYTEFLEIIALPGDGWIAKLKRYSKLFLFFAAGRLRQFWIFIRTAYQSIDSPLHATYYSMTPYLLGNGMVVRYAAIPRPAATRDPPRQGKNADGFLQAAMTTELNPAPDSEGHLAVFDFAVQLRHSATPDDVEDASRDWRGAKDIQVTLGRLEIGRQTFATPARLCAGENLSFSPWHCLPQHRPIGGLNRMRLAVYRASLNTRRRLNMVQA